jgi:hypothetical protein
VGGLDGDFGVSGSFLLMLSLLVVELELSVDISAGMDDFLEEGVVLSLRDILLGFWV